MDTTGRGDDLYAGLSILGKECEDSFEMPGAASELGSAQDGGFITSIGSSGPLLSCSRWGISTLSQGESVQWNVGDDGIFKPWSSSVHTAGDSFISCSTMSASMSQGFSEVVKTDPRDWASMLALKEDGKSKCQSSGGVNSPPLPVGTMPTCVGDDTSETASKADVARGKSSGGHLASRLVSAPLGLELSRTGAITTSALGLNSKVKGEAKEVDVEGDGEDEDEKEEEDDEDDDEYGKGEIGEMGSTSELSEKRRRNRDHAKRSRMRKRVRLGGLEEMVLELRRENVRLRQMVKKRIPDRAEDIIRACASDNTDADIVAKQDVVQGMRPGMGVLGAGWGSRLSGGSRSRPRSNNRHSGSKDRRVPSALKLMSPAYQSVKALSDSQANFILTNPNLEGCPIIFASPGFLELTGYEASQVMGKNCRFLQGPGTDPDTVSIIRNNLAEGRDASVCILNYKADGTPFWNQLSIGNLLDCQGQVANNVGVLCEVQQMPAADFHRLLHRVPLPEGLLHDTSSDSGDEAIDSKSRGRSKEPGGYSAAGIPGGTPGSPRVVDRLRRTRAASAADQVT